MHAVHLSKEFARLARRHGIDDRSLGSALDRAERGLADADLGGSLIKQRVPRPGQGRSGGFRTIVCYQREKRAVFLHLFEKSRQSNLNAAELEAYQKLARHLDTLTDNQLDDLVETRGWRRIERKKDDEEDLSQ